MYRSMPNASTRSSVLRLAGLGIAAGLAVLAARARADDLPRPASSPAVLTLGDGGFINGTLNDSSQPGLVRWKSPEFVNSLDFNVSRLQSIRFPTDQKAPRPDGLFGFELTGGDLLFGSVVKLDDKKAELEVAKLGRIVVDRSRLRRIFRWKDGADLVYNGPNGMAGWKEVVPVKKAVVQNNQAPQMAPMVRFNAAGVIQPAQLAVKPAAKAADGPRWSEEGGQLVTNQPGVSLLGDVGLPARASIEIDLSWKKTPNFIIALGVSDDEETVDRAFRIEVWNGQIVAYRMLEQEADVVPIQPVGAGPGEARLQLYLDQEAGKLLVSTSAGTSLEELNPAGRRGKPLSSVRITNVQGDIRLERLRVGRWDGETPRPVDPKLSRVQLTDQTSVRGQVDRLDPATREFVIKSDSGETRVAEEKVSNIFLAQPGEEIRRPVRGLYQDGTRISGALAKVEGGLLVLDSPGIDSPLRLTMEGIASVEFGGGKKELAFNEKPAEKPPLTGTLEMEGVRLDGRLVASGDKPGEEALAWKPIDGESSGRIRPGASGQVVYRSTQASHANRPAVPSDPNGQPVKVVRIFDRRVGLNNNAAVTTTATLGTNTRQANPNNRSIYLRTGDIIPGEVISMDEKGLTIKTDLSPNTLVPHSQVKAVEIATEFPMAARLTRAKFDRLLTLPRMQRESPPTHLIRSKNGDILRARIVSMDDKTIRVEVRLDEKEIPRDRVSKIIWLHADETDPSKKPPAAPAVAGRQQVQVVKTDGIRLTFNAERCAGDTLDGTSDVLGACHVPLQDVDVLLIGGSVEKEATQLAYQNWKLVNAPEPKSAQDEEAEDGGDGGGVGGGAGKESPLVGKPAPDFTLDLVGGAKFHLADHKGKVIVLDFWATWCGPCLQAMPQIDKVTHEFADKGVQLVAVNLQESPEKIKGLLERIKLSPTVALDRDGSVAQRYAANAIPQTVVIDKDGKITRLFVGGGPKLGDQLRQALEELIPPEKKD